MDVHATGPAHRPRDGDAALGAAVTRPNATTNRSRGARVPGWIRELALIAVVYGVYEASRGLVRGDTPAALANARHILGWETAWHLDPEHALNQLLAHSTAAAVGCSYYYAALHYLVTSTVLIWIWRRHRQHYRIARDTILAATLFGLAGFLLTPTAPPRLLPGAGITDTLTATSGYGWWHVDGSVPRGMGGLADQYAAMPSLHVGWALWAGVAVLVLARRGWVRTLGGLYPLATAFVVLATGNHYLLDAIAGAATMIAGATAAVLLASWRLRHARTPLPRGRGMPAASARQAPSGSTTPADGMTSHRDRSRRQPTVASVMGARCGRRSAQRRLGGPSASRLDRPRLQLSGRLGCRRGESDPDERPGNPKHWPGAGASARRGRLLLR